MNKFMEKPLVINIFKFLIVGVCSTIIDFILYIIFSSYIHITIAKAMSMMVSSVVSYIFNKIWTFENYKKTNTIYLIKYYVTFIINMGTNLAINYYIYIYMGSKVIAFIVATICAMTINFFLQKFFVFKVEKSDE